MPNGFHGPGEDWERIEAPLRVLDDALDAYAREHGLALSRNARIWPERSLRWGTGIERLVQVFLADEKRVTFNVWLCASEDRGRERYWKQRLLRRELAVEELAAGLIEMLDAARVEVEGWSSEDLEPAGRIGG